MQYDIPKRSSWFVHRSGRTARSGIEGRALLLLTREEEAYIPFIQSYEHLELKPYTLDGLSHEAAMRLRDRVRKLAANDRCVRARVGRSLLLTGVRVLQARPPQWHTRVRRQDRGLHPARLPDHLQAQRCVAASSENSN